MAIESVHLTRCLRTLRARRALVRVIKVPHRKINEPYNHVSNDSKNCGRAASPVKTLIRSEKRE